PTHWQRGAVVESVVQAAAAMGTLAVIRDSDGAGQLASKHKHVFPLVSSPEAAADDPFRTAPVVMVPDCADIAAVQALLKRQNPERVVAIRMEASPVSAERIVQLTREGAEVIHLVFDKHGRESAAAKPRHARDVLREIHRALVKEGIRDQVTLIASGGIALAEHKVLGAMGIREVRRLRGETGRAMFFEDLERDSFGKIFGKRKKPEGAD
ncbi:MAG: hypothetical protein ABSA77_12500, partial [Thermoguttaceae bacterium]